MKTQHPAYATADKKIAKQKNAMDDRPHNAWIVQLCGGQAAADADVVLGHSARKHQDIHKRTMAVHAVNRVEN